MKGESRGFTLLEVLIAVAILSISLTSLVSSQMASLRNTAYARQLSAMVFLAESQLIEIEFELKQDGGWGTDDQTFDGDFSEEGWPDVTYYCVADMIEMPEYQQLLEAKSEADTDGFGNVGGGYDMQDTGDQAFSAMGMVWPIVKEAIEQSIRKSWCTVRWEEEGGGRKKRRTTTGTADFCGDDENNCLTLMTYWTDSTKLMQLPSAGGEADETDDVDDGGEDGGAGGPGGGGGAKGGGARGGGGGSSRNPGVPAGPGANGGMNPGGRRP